MPTRPRLAPCLALLTLLLGCTETREVPWTLRAPPDVEGNVARVEVRISEGTCGSPNDVVFEAAFAPGDAPQPPSLAPGDYAFHADLFDSLCRRVASGCSELTGDSVEIRLNSRNEGCEGICVEGECQPRLGDGGVPQDASPPSECTALPSIAVATGSSHSCALDLGTKLHCWGNNQRGQLGNGTLGGEPRTEATLSFDERLTAAALGPSTGCALDTDGVLHCWGNGRLHAPTPSDDDQPTPVRVADDVSAFDVGISHSCMVAAGTATCWGDDSAGQLATPALPFSQFALGEFHSCGLIEGTVRCWGANNQGQLGRGTLCDDSPDECALPADDVSIPVTVVRISAGNNHTCALTREGSLYCFGANIAGQLGVGDETNRPSPTLVPAPNGRVWLTVSAGGNHTCAIAGRDLEDTDGLLYCWGLGSNGQLGLGDQDDRSAPTMAASNFATISAGSGHTCGVLRSGEAQCWGSGGQGQLGGGNTRDRTVPTRVCVAQ